jgi:putative transposase
MEIDLIEPGFYYHIYNRGINREIIFPEDCFYMKFLCLFEKYMSGIADTLAYCLLPTHFHFLLYIKEHPAGVPSNYFSFLFNSYAQWFNKRKHRNGGLFQSPFKRKRVTSQEYLKQVIYYIHRNPMHHNYVDNPAHYMYSSYNSIISDDPTQIQKQFVLELFDSRDNFIYFHHHQFEVDKLLVFEV